MPTPQNTSHSSVKKQEKSEQGLSSWKQKVQDLVKNKLLEIIVGIIVAVIGWAIHDLPNEVDELDKTVSNVNTRLEILEGNYAILNSQIWSMNKLASDNQGSSTDMDAESNSALDTDVLLASTELTAGMLEHPPKEKDDNFFVNMNIYQNDTIIGFNLQTNENVTKESMENDPFIMQYEEKGEEVFFYGQFNEHSQWNGNCIINRYKNSKLKSVMEAFYNNGELESYQEIFIGTNLQNQKIWYVSNRVVENGRMSGETVTYFFYGDYEKRFNNETIRKEDILTINDFIVTIPSTVEGYYNGYTSDGKYNDESGNAYLIKYTPNGTVRYLYKGKIKNGYPNDDTGNAWSISLGYANDGYYYYKGIFKNGEHGKAPKNWEPMTQEDIKDKVNPNDFAYPLTGLVNDMIINKTTLDEKT